jgi:serine/threonine protein kinase
MPAVDDFLRTVLKSGLLDREQLSQTLRAVPAEHRTEPLALAEQLVGAGKLSRFQARKLLQGVSTGLVLGPFHVLAPVGKGGMATVFLARDTRSKQLLALKILAPKKAREEPRMLARFRREMDMNQRVAHDHIAWTYDVGVCQQIYYIAMEYIPGKSLHRVVAESGPLKVPRAARLFAEVAAALAHAHERHIIHRDLKPSNIVITPHDHAKLLDLGFAIVEGETGGDKEVIGGEGYVVGTMDYISPEQIANSATVTTRSDIYGLGCSLYYTVTGRVPFPGGTAKEKIQRHKTEWPAPVTRINPDVPTEFAALVGKMLMKDPAARYASAEEVRQELLKWCVGEKALPLDRPEDRTFQDAVAALDTGELVMTADTAETEPLSVIPVEDEPAKVLPAELEANPFAELTASLPPPPSRRKSGVYASTENGARGTLLAGGPALQWLRSRSSDELFLYAVAAGALFLLSCGVVMTGLILLLARR